LVLPPVDGVPSPYVSTGVLPPQLGYRDMEVRVAVLSGCGGERVVSASVEIFVNELEGEPVAHCVEGGQLGVWDSVAR
jgi:hypothetical protein